MTKAREINRQIADANNAVVTVTGGDHLYRRQPCQECPWRQDAPVGAFPAEAFRISANTAYDMSSHTFACHMSGTAKPTICAGFLLAGAAHNMAVRLGCLRGLIDPRQVSSPVALYDSYADMAIANGVDPDDPALARCRKP